MPRQSRFLASGMGAAVSSFPPPPPSLLFTLLFELILIDCSSHSEKELAHFDRIRAMFESQQM